MYQTTQSSMELQARESWAMHGALGVESVALIVNGVWFALTNTAAMPSGEFDVSGEEVNRALQEAMSIGMLTEAEYEAIFEAAAGDITIDMDDRVCEVWHSHIVTVAPSRADIAWLPGWMKHGIVYHAPSETRVLYKSDGTIEVASDISISRNLPTHSRQAGA